MSSKFLIDTHVFLWAIGAPEKLSPAAAITLSDKTNEIFLSRASYWEICIKVSKGTLKLGPDWQEVLEQERRANRFLWLDITSEHCDGIIALPKHHKDPFDRLLISQANSEQLTLISGDGKLADYAVDLLW